MKLGFLTDGVGRKSFDEVLEFASELGVEGIELATGNWSEAPHLNLDELRGNPDSRRRLLRGLEDRGLELLALNANGNQLHPIEGDEHDRVVRRTIELAADLGVPTVVLMSGLPGARGDRLPNWITSSWPPEAVEILRYQWEKVALPYWEDLAGLARRLGVRLAVEMHGRQLVHNPASFHRLQDAIGDDVVGANLDPSHLMWQGCDILAVVEDLGSSIAHVHAKDIRIEPRRNAINGLLDPLAPAEARQRSWNYVTLGQGHAGGATFWRDFVYALRSVGYTGPLSIEHEDVIVSGEEGIRRAVDILKPAIFRQAPDWVPAEV